MSELFFWGGIIAGVAAIAFAAGHALGRSGR
jgi:hypothetical protein